MYYQDILSGLIDTCFLVKVVTRHSSDKPWVTDRFRDLVRARERARMRDKTSPEAHILRNKVNRMAHRLRSNFYKNKVAALQDSCPKNWWKNMKALMGLKNKGESDLASLASQEADGDLSQLANSINDFMVSVTGEMPKLEESHAIFQNLSQLPAEFTIETAETERALLKLKTGKATGPDAIPVWVLKDFAHILSGPLTAIFNSSLRQGVVPSSWKSSYVVPLPKQRPPKSIAKDLRPISLTPIAAKVLETLVSKRINASLDGKIDEKQFAGIGGVSTTNALVEMTHRLYEGTDHAGNFARLLLLDYSKGFDLVNHNILISKLLNIGIPSHIRWLAAFLLTARSVLKSAMLCPAKAALKAGYRKAH